MEPHLPIGTVTFLLTDIEGSTRLWEEHPDAMGHALTRHDALAAAAVERCDGRLVKSRGEGDSLFAVFGRATDAVAAACALQHGLATEPWPSETPLRVRAALHTGEADLREGDYYGTVVNRCARLRAAAHGGQVLLSLATQELVRDHLPHGVDLRDLGQHRLRDLARPERIFQLLHPSLPSEFPPLRTLDVRPNNLPTQPTPLIGREHEVEALRTLLRRDDARLVTLIGPGGTGKTRLGLQVAADLLEAFADGVFLVPLASVYDASLVLTTIAHTLGLQDTAGRSLLESLIEHLKSKHLLLLLDNFEQVLPAAAPLAELLAAAPQLTVLVTSRVILRLRGEKVFQVPPLALPDPQSRLSLESLSQYAAVALFIQRALDAKPEFAVTNENAPAVAEICHRLDGLPLAIELAAARIRILPPEAMLSRLGNRLKLLTGGARDLPARQQTLRGTIDWSCDLLPEGDQQLFRRLSVFVGGCTLEAAETVCAGEGDLELDILEGVESLVSQSLLRQEAGEARFGRAADSAGGRTPGPGAEPRFIMLETIREYAHDRLRESGEAEALRRQHARFYLALAKKANPMLGGPESRAWLDRLEREHDNLRAAVDWFIEVQEAEGGFQLGAVLARFWFWRGYLTEGRQRLAALLALPQAADTAARAEVLTRAGAVAYLQGDYEQAESLSQQSLAIARALGDRATIILALHYLADVAVARNDNTAARAYHQEKVDLARDAGDWFGVAGSLIGLGGAAYRQGDLDTAQAFYEESLALARKTGMSSFGLTNPLNCLGCVARDRGDYASARELHEQALAIGRELDNKIILTVTLYDLGMLAQRQGESVQARAHYEECLAIHREMGSKPGIDSCLRQIEQLASTQEEPA